MRAICLSGGASSGAWEAGILKRLLYDQQTYYDVLCGISVGAINICSLAQHKKGEEKQSYELMEKLWLQVSNKDVWKYRFPPFISAIWSNSFYKTTPLRKFLEKNLDIERLKSSGKLLRIGAVSLTSGQYKVWTEKDENLIEILMASCAFPGFFESINIDGEIFVDGGIRTVTPLHDAIKTGASDIDVILTAKGGTPKQMKKWYVKDVLSRAFEIMFDEVVNNDLKLCLERNNNPNYRKINIRVFRPSVSLVGDLNFDPKVAKLQIEQGYQDALNWDIL